MKYVLYLHNDHRIHSACVALSGRDYGDAPIVDTLPEGDITDYRYVRKKFVYDPLPKEPEQPDVPVAPRNVVAGEYITVNGTLYKTLVNVPSGEPIITGQNAVETTIEEQLHELTKGE